MAGRLSLLGFICAVHVVAILAFVQGFFLTRYELRAHSSCEVPSPPHPATAYQYVPSLENATCWHRPAFSRAILIVIDALRFDFIRHDPKLPQDKAGFYQNKMPHIHRLYRDSPENSFLFRFLSDPPTTTSQRLKGIMTGGLPTFLDMKENFNSGALEEDNVITQLKRAGKSMVFMGDDTWEGLFPGHFVRSYGFPSFNVKDLHTVDNGVIEHLLPELRRSDWDFVVAHFLGVDHAGHRYGSEHPAMADKLAQLDAVIKNVTDVMDEDTLLIVFGDHGMTPDGNHGGASEDETTASLLFYSHKPLNRRLHSRASRDVGEFRSVPQIDLAPTLALLLGVPVPFASLGVPIPEVFLGTDLEEDLHLPPLPSDPKDQTALRESTEALNNIHHQTARQLMTFLDAYSALSNVFPAETMAELRELFHDTNAKYSRLAAESARDNLRKYLAAHEEVFLAYRRFQAQLSEMCRLLWTTFDYSLMVLGSVGMILATLALVGAAFREPDPLPTRAMFCTALACTALAALWFRGPALGLIPAASIGATLGLLAASRYTLSFDLSASVPSVALVVITLLHALSLVSNSYIEAQPTVIQFLLAAAFLVCAAGAGRASWLTVGSLAIVARLSKMFAAEGRHEGYRQRDALWSSLALECLLPTAAIALYVCVRARRMRADLSAPLRGVLFGFVPAGLACVALYRVLQAVHYLDAQPELIRTLLPRLVYMLALAAFAVLVRAPRSAFASSLHAMLYGVTANLLPTFLLLLGPQASPAVLLLLVQRDLFLHLHAGSKRASFPVTALLWGFFTLQYFFFTGHVCDVASVHFEAGYYGSEEFNLMLSPTLVVINTFASPLFFALSLPMLSLVQNQQTPAAKSAALPNSLFQSLVVYLSFFSLNATVMNLVVFVHRRHLMVWRVFAPKFLFDQVFLLVAMALMLIAFATLEKRLGAMKPVQKTNGLHLH